MHNWHYLHAIHAPYRHRLAVVAMHDNSGSAPSARDRNNPTSEVFFSFSSSTHAHFSLLADLSTAYALLFMSLCERRTGFVRNLTKKFRHSIFTLQLYEIAVVLSLFFEYSLYLSPKTSASSQALTHFRYLCNAIVFAGNGRRIIHFAEATPPLTHMRRGTTSTLHSIALSPYAVSRSPTEAKCARATRVATMIERVLIERNKNSTFKCVCVWYSTAHTQ